MCSLAIACKLYDVERGYGDSIEYVHEHIRYDQNINRQWQGKTWQWRGEEGKRERERE